MQELNLKLLIFGERQSYGTQERKGRTLAWEQPDPNLSPRISAICGLWVGGEQGPTKKQALPTEQHHTQASAAVGTAGPSPFQHTGWETVSSPSVSDRLIERTKGFSDSCWGEMQVDACSVLVFH